MSSSVAPAKPIAAPVHGPQRMNIVIVGHVDHGKSTVIGRLLADTHSLPEGKLEQVRASCERNSKPFEYAFLLDALKDEQAQGITIDAARVFFKTARRPYLILDAPGHIEFLKNMITGAARAEAALLVIDAQEGVQENSRRHGYMLSLLGIRQIAVLVNKMDLVGWDRARVRPDRARVRRVPRAGRHPARVLHPRRAAAAATTSPTGPPTCPGTRDRRCSRRSTRSTPSPRRSTVRSGCRCRASTSSPSRATIAASSPGTIDSGAVSVGDEVDLLSLGQEEPGQVHRGIQSAGQTQAAAPARPPDSRCTSRSTSRAARCGARRAARPQVTTRLRVSVFWLGKEPMVRRKEYLLKLGTARVTARVEEILRVMDASTLEAAEQRTRGPAPRRCRMRAQAATARSRATWRRTSPATSRFVIVDDFEIRGGGIVREALPDRQTARARPGAAAELQVGAQHHPAGAARGEVQPEGRR